ncbi:MAG TPA: lipoyl(octanoyl) transferase LipB [Gemmatimonadales bacterium]|nr:lipoyl(octanoyl) transferase LipB [Gemmatimonadales bacterium]
MNPLQVLDLGRRPYAPVLNMQRALCRARIEGTLTDDVLLLVEHDSVVTLGRGARATSLPLPPDELRRRGIAVEDAERGGDVTWHGPGQLVGYPILDLARHRQDVHWYLRQLEAALIDALARLDVHGERAAGLTGVWTAGRKIASIGIHVKRWVTLHGFALNVVGDLGPFELIVPCGIAGVRMTNVAAERGGGDNPAALWRETRAEVVAAIGRAFSLEPMAAALDGCLLRATRPSSLHG